MDKKKQSKMCQICGDVAKSMHFGGLSCDSCKAFFRRSVQNDAFKHFRCGGDRTCSISIASRKFCKFCRFSKCERVGMVQEWVMSEDERVQLMKSRHTKKVVDSGDDEAAKEQSSLYTSYRGRVALTAGGAPNLHGLNRRRHMECRMREEGEVDPSIYGSCVSNVAQMPEREVDPLRYGSTVQNRSEEEVDPIINEPSVKSKIQRSVGEFDPVAYEPAVKSKIHMSEEGIDPIFNRSAAVKSKNIRKGKAYKDVEVISLHESSSFSYSSSSSSALTTKPEYRQEKNPLVAVNYDPIAKYKDPVYHGQELEGARVSILDISSSKVCSTTAAVRKDCIGGKGKWLTTSHAEGANTKESDASESQNQYALPLDAAGLNRKADQNLQKKSCTITNNPYDFQSNVPSLPKASHSQGRSSHAYSVVDKENDLGEISNCQLSPSISASQGYESFNIPHNSSQYLDARSYGAQSGINKPCIPYVPHEQQTSEFGPQHTTRHSLSSKRLSAPLPSYTKTSQQLTQGNAENIALQRSRELDTSSIINPVCNVPSSTSDNKNDEKDTSQTNSSDLSLSTFPKDPEKYTVMINERPGFPITNYMSRTELIRLTNLVKNMQHMEYRLPYKNISKEDNVMDHYFQFINRVTFFLNQFEEFTSFSVIEQQRALKDNITVIALIFGSSFMNKTGAFRNTLKTHSHTITDMSSIKDSLTPKVFDKFKEVLGVLGQFHVDIRMAYMIILTIIFNREKHPTTHQCYRRLLYQYICWKYGEANASYINSHLFKVVDGIRHHAYVFEGMATSDAMKGTSVKKPVPVYSHIDNQFIKSEVVEAASVNSDSMRTAMSQLGGNKLSVLREMFYNGASMDQMASYFHQGENTPVNPNTSSDDVQGSNICQPGEKDSVKSYIASVVESNTLVELVPHPLQSTADNTTTLDQGTLNKEPSYDEQRYDISDFLPSSQTEVHDATEIEGAMGKSIPHYMANYDVSKLRDLYQKGDMSTLKSMFSESSGAMPNMIAELKKNNTGNITISSTNVVSETEENTSIGENIPQSVAFDQLASEYKAGNASQINTSFNENCNTATDQQIYPAAMKDKLQQQGVSGSAIQGAMGENIKDMLSKHGASKLKAMYERGDIKDLRAMYLQSCDSTQNREMLSYGTAQEHKQDEGQNMAQFAAFPTGSMSGQDLSALKKMYQEQSTSGEQDHSSAAGSLPATEYRETTHYHGKYGKFRQMLEEKSLAERPSNSFPITTTVTINVFSSPTYSDTFKEQSSDPLTNRDDKQSYEQGSMVQYHPFVLPTNETPIQRFPEIDFRGVGVEPVSTFQSAPFNSPTQQFYPQIPQPSIYPSNDSQNPMGEQPPNFGIAQPSSKIFHQSYKDYRSSGNNDLFSSGPGPLFLPNPTEFPNFNVNPINTNIPYSGSALHENQTSSAPYDSNTKE